MKNGELDAHSGLGRERARRDAVVDKVLGNVSINCRELKKSRMSEVEQVLWSLAHRVVEEHYVGVKVRGTGEAHARFLPTAESWSA